MGPVVAIRAAELGAGFEDGQQVIQDRELAENRFLLREVAEAEAGAPHPYRAGKWGPAAADEMLARDGRTWRRP